MRVVIIGGAELVMYVFSVHGSCDNNMSLYTGRYVHVLPDHVHYVLNILIPC